ncbi:vanadium-dependent haloperoxidase [Streptomyces sp. I05A-00742]|uniref:vanadium-dependent haloperoxidase n=1 Tax=Streptomyces sp. I05A-00742 TaxID=2732853 RepID=UPI001BB2563C|nr:vanadium-dependent haloperoxidase [Streptomyces sp. I05A-00742]
MTVVATALALVGVLTGTAIPAAPGPAAPRSATTGPVARAAVADVRPLSAAADPAAVVRDWNVVAARTIDEGLGPTRPSGQTALWHGLVAVAVYNAVTGIERNRYVPYRWRESAPRGASAQAAAVAAAHRVLTECFPASRARLDTAYAESLAGLPDGHAKRQGAAFGERAAGHLLALRRHEGGLPRPDGRPVPPGGTTEQPPGIWRPTPPRNEAFIDQWLSTTHPMLLTSPAQFRPAGPPSLTSARYARDLAEIAAMGARTGSRRTPNQTETATFFGGNLVAQFQSAFRDHSVRHRLDLVETARLFAAGNAVAADTVIATWDAKRHYAFWRPITAIREADRDGNPRTRGVRDWQPLLDTPPHPEYIAGHATVAGAVTQALLTVLGSPHLDLNLPAPGGGTARHYTSAAHLNQDMTDARVWAGVHFRSSDITGCLTGARIGRWTTARYFRPSDAAVSQTRPPAGPEAVCGVHSGK